MHLIPGRSEARHPNRFAVAGNLAGLAAVAIALVLGVAALGQAARAEPARATPVVAELFTSQSCSSCPPAEALFRRLAGRSDLITLEWHVDYWDTLDDPRGGRWKDPYSSPAFTARQRAYNRAIRGRGDVYTPQAVIGGVQETVGSNAGGIGALIAHTDRTQDAIRIAASRDSSIHFGVAGAPADAEAELVAFRDRIETRVRAGENKGASLASAHVVIGRRSVALAAAIDVPIPGPGEGCALLVRDPASLRILAAAYCPA